MIIHFIKTLSIVNILFVFITINQYNYSKCCNKNKEEKNLEIKKKNYCGYKNKEIQKNNENNQKQLENNNKKDDSEEELNEEDNSKDKKLPKEEFNEEHNNKDKKSPKDIFPEKIEKQKILTDLLNDLIKNNSLLDNKIEINKINFENKIDKIQNIEDFNKINQELNDIKINLMNNLNTLKNNLQNEFNKLKNDINQLNNKKDDVEKILEIKIDNNLLNDIFVDFNFEKIEEIKNKISNLKNIYDNGIKEIQNKIKEKILELNKNNIKKIKIDINNNDIEEANDNKKILIIYEKFNSYKISIESDINVLINSINSQIKNIENEKELLKSIGKKEIENELNNFKNELNINKSDINKLSTLLTNINTYINECNTLKNTEKTKLNTKLNNLNEIKKYIIDNHKYLIKKEDDISVEIKIDNITDYNNTINNITNLENLIKTAINDIKNSLKTEIDNLNIDLEKYKLENINLDILNNLNNYSSSLVDLTKNLLEQDINNINELINNKKNELENKKNEIEEKQNEVIKLFKNVDNLDNEIRINFNIGDDEEGIIEIKYSDDDIKNTFFIDDLNKIEKELNCELENLNIINICFSLIEDCKKLNDKLYLDKIKLEINKNTLIKEKNVEKFKEYKTKLEDKKIKIENEIKKQEEEGISKDIDKFIEYFDKRIDILIKDKNYFIDKNLKKILKTNKLKDNKDKYKDIIKDYSDMFFDMTDKNEVFNYQVAIDLQIYRHILYLFNFTSALDEIFKNEIKYYFTMFNTCNKMYGYNLIGKDDYYTTTELFNKKDDVSSGLFTVNNEKFKYLRCKGSCKDNNCISCKLREFLKNEKIYDLFLKIYHDYGDGKVGDGFKAIAFLTKVVRDGLKENYKNKDHYIPEGVDININIEDENFIKAKKCIMLEWALTIEFMKRFIPNYYDGSNEFYLYRTFKPENYTNFINLNSILDGYVESTCLIAPAFIPNLVNHNYCSFTQTSEPVKFYRCYFNHIISPNEKTILLHDFEHEIGFIGINKKYKLVESEKDHGSHFKNFISFLTAKRKENFNKNCKK